MNRKLTLLLLLISTTGICMEQGVRKKWIELDEVKALCKTIHKLVTLDTFEPDLLVTMPRGGMIPTGVFAGAEMFNIRDIRFISTASYDDNNKQGEIKLQAPFHAEDFEGFKKILLIDDLVDTGLTMKFVLALLREKLPADTIIKVATLYYKEKSCIKPDYFALTTADWIVFPWEV